MPDVIVKYKGAEYTIPENRLFEVGEAIEEIAPLFTVHSWIANPNFHKIARCYAVLLNAAGVKAKAADLHREFMEKLMAGDDTSRDAVGHVLTVLTDGVIGGLMSGSPQDGVGEVAEGESKAS